MVKFFFSENVNKMRLSEWLKTYRKQAGISQKQLADSITDLGYQITDTQISNYEREYDKDRDGNPTRPKEKFLELAAQVLDRPIDEARTVAGYVAKDSGNSDTHDILDGVKIIFQNGKGLTKKQQQEILDAARLIARGVQANGEKE